MQWRQGSEQAVCLPVTRRPLSAALLQKYLDNYDLSVRVIYVLGTLGFSVGTAVMAMFANVYVAMIMISTMGVVSMSISYCPYALLGQYHDIREVGGRAPEGRPRPRGRRLWAALRLSPALSAWSILAHVFPCTHALACGLPGTERVRVCVV